MSGIKLEAGQWYRVRQGSIVYCASESVKKKDAFLCECFNSPFLVKQNGMHYQGNSNWDVVEHLPDCTGFDWVPPKRPDAPDGWRWVEDEETIAKGDNYYRKDTINPIPDIVSSCIGQTWSQARHRFSFCWGILRKIEPKYRPFANAKEFEPHRDKWIRRREGVGACRTDSYSDDGHFTGGIFDTWEDMFLNNIFEDGSPFGVVDE